MPLVRTNDIETYYERRGEGPPVVFVHSAFLDHRQWTPQVEALADEYETVTYDLRGLGRSGGSNEDRYTIELYAADLAALVDELGLDSPVVCGLSLGGLVAQTYAVRYDCDVRGLVLADTAASMTLRLRDRLLVALTPAWTVTGAMRVLGMARVADLGLRLAARTLGREWLPRDPADLAYVGRAIAAVDPAEATRSFRATWGFRGVDLASVDVPTLVLTGEHEAKSFLAQARALERSIPDSRRVVVPAAGHLSNLDNPEAFTAELRTFLESLDVAK